MKLFQKFNRINIIVAMFSFLIGSIAFYIALNYVLISQLDRSLRVEEQEILSFVNKNDSFPEIHDTRHQWIEKKKVKTAIEQTTPYSTVAFNPLIRLAEPVRQYRFNVLVGEQRYVATVSQSKTETEELLKLIIPIILGMIGLLMILNYLIGRKMMNRIWEPFYISIKHIDEYKVGSGNIVQLPKVGIDEINLLNEQLNNMTTRIYNDYISLKRFTENASHEMQTPLAVIRSRVDALLQDEQMSENAINELSVIENTVLKLSRMQQSLLLLTKLENRQFSEQGEIQLSVVMQHCISFFAEIYDAAGITVIQQISGGFNCKYPYLADILVSNLFKNAIRYTPCGGIITIKMDEVKFSISNTASAGSLDQSLVFQRFYTASNSEDSTGLGLAIAKEICDTLGWTISYTYQNAEHCFIVQK
jgi:signal transduction histidine kinase